MAISLPSIDVGSTNWGTNVNGYWATLEDAINNKMIAAGTLANRPAAATDNAGTLYFATDSSGGTLYRSDGSAWAQAAKGVTEAATPSAHHTSHESGGSDAIKLDNLAAPDDNTDLNVTSSAHGLAPKSPADATKFLNGAATPAFAQVKDSDLSTSDITTNDLTTTKHGFAPKAPNDASKFLDGTGAWSAPVPPGVVVPYVATTAPTGWIVCDGSAISRTTYAALFAIIGTTYGSGDGSTTFNIPDMRARVPVGYNNSGTLNPGTNQRTNKAMAAASGEETHALSTAELATHSHTQNSHSHNTTYSYMRCDNTSLYPGAGGAVWCSGSSDNTTSSVTATNQNTGSGTAHQTMQPYLTLNYIIKT